MACSQKLFLRWALNLQKGVFISVKGTSSTDAILHKKMFLWGENDLFAFERKQVSLVLMHPSTSASVTRWLD